jgi:hypothetical protein
VEPRVVEGALQAAAEQGAAGAADRAVKVKISGLTQNS